MWEREGVTPSQGCYRTANYHFILRAAAIYLHSATAWEREGIIPSQGAEVWGTLFYHGGGYAVTSARHISLVCAREKAPKISVRAAGAHCRRAA